LKTSTNKNALHLIRTAKLEMIHVKGFASVGLIAHSVQQALKIQLEINSNPWSGVSDNIVRTIPILSKLEDKQVPSRDSPRRGIS